MAPGYASRQKDLPKRFRAILRTCIDVLESLAIVQYTHNQFYTDFIGLMILWVTIKKKKRQTSGVQRVCLFSGIAASETFAIGGFAHFDIQGRTLSGQSISVSVVAMGQRHNSFPKERFTAAHAFLHRQIESIIWAWMNLKKWLINTLRNPEGWTTDGWTWEEHDPSHLATPISPSQVLDRIPPSVYSSERPLKENTTAIIHSKNFELRKTVLFYFTFGDVNRRWKSFTSATHQIRFAGKSFPRRTGTQENDQNVQEHDMIIVWVIKMLKWFFCF